jgi:hypothetical protein
MTADDLPLRIRQEIRVAHLAIEVPAQERPAEEDPELGGKAFQELCAIAVRS